MKQRTDRRRVASPTLTISHPTVHVAIVGARRASQLDGTLSAAEVRLSERDRGDIPRILSEAVPVTGPSPEGM